MIHTDTIRELQQHVETWRKQGKSIAIVPTMGNLHYGHLLLVEDAKKRADITITSIFVNPIQFDKQADLDAYPHTLKQDLKMLEAKGCDLVFSPSVESMYGKGKGKGGGKGNNKATTTIEVDGFSDTLEGASRPGHFVGVATVVAKLFNLTCADFAIFGQKDYQQLMLVTQMAKDLSFKTKIIGHPTVREDDGLAMSSRNGYLTKEERAIAPLLQQTLQKIRQQLLAGSTDYDELISTAKKSLSDKGFNPDYIVIRRQKDLELPEPDDKEIVVLASVWLGKARLLDNIPFRLNKVTF